MNINALVFDIETKTFNDEINKDKDIHRITGAYSYKTKKKQFTVNKSKIQQLINEHDIIIGHNIKNYDIPVLKRFGITFYFKTIIDTVEIARKRLKVLLGIESEDNSLGTLAKLFNFPILKGDIDYSIFQKESHEWTEEEKKEIIKYLNGDIECSKLLFEYFYNEFNEFKQFVTEKNKNNWTWLTCSSGSLSYKVLCNIADLEEEYGQRTFLKEDGGGLVLFPTGDEYRNVWYLDYTSLYPWINSIFNLFANPKLCPDAKKWFTGNDVFKVKGKYSLDERHILSKKTIEMYNNRKLVKQSNPKLAQAYKIILNGEYGNLRSKMFKSTYYQYTGYDCCMLGQQFNNIIIKFFEKVGFKSIYGDTDSRFLIYEGDNMDIKEQYKLLNKTKKEIIDYIMNNVPFPAKGFDLESETGELPIKYIKFVKKEGTEEYAKKNYVYLTYDNKVTIKGLPFKKQGSTKVTEIIFNKYLKEQIIKKGSCNFSEAYLLSLIKDTLKKDITLASMMYKVQPYEKYKNKNDIHAKISKQYLKGKWGKIRLIKNKVKGLVKDQQGNFYCNEEEGKALQLNDLIYDKIKTELKPFIKKTENKGVFDY